MYIYQNDKTSSHYNCLHFKSQTLLITIRRIQFLIDSTNYRNQFEMCQLSSSMLVLLFHHILCPSLVKINNANFAILFQPGKESFINLGYPPKIFHVKEREGR